MKINYTIAGKIDRKHWPALALIAFWIVALVTGLGTPNGWITTSSGKPVDGDYAGIYTAGSLALSGDALSAYDWDRSKAAQRALIGDTNSGFYPWPYPPTFLFVASALATLPYWLSMLTWTLSTLGALGAALSRICTTRRDLLFMLATPAIWLNLYIGQNGALSAALLGFGLVLLPVRPIVAGICIGLLSFKPHLGLLIPIALIAGGYWRSFAAAAVTTGTIALAATAVYGTAPWIAMPAQLANVVTIVSGTDQVHKLQSLFGFVRGLGGSADLAMTLQLGLTALLACANAWLWRQPNIDFDLKAAALAAAITLASPYLFVYDLVVLTIAQAFLLRHLAKTGIDDLELAGLKLANILIFLFPLLPVPLGVAGSAAVMALIVRRIAATRTEVLARPAPVATAKT